MKMRNYLLTALLLAATFSLQAQSSFDINVDLQSRYIWRGQELGQNYPSIQPSMTYSYNGLSIGAWSAIATSDIESSELDLFISYDFIQDGMFSIIFTDYYCPTTLHYSYFEYDQNTTSHLLEAGLLYNGTERVPLGAAVYTNLYGNDAKNENGDNVFSTYGEIFYRPSIERWNTDLNFAAGFAFNGEDGYYGNDGFDCVNLTLGASKTLEITEKFSLPIMTNLIFNPTSEHVYLVVGASISL